MSNGQRRATLAAMLSTPGVIPIFETELTLFRFSFFSHGLTRMFTDRKRAKHRIPDSLIRVYLCSSVALLLATEGAEITESGFWL